MPGGTYTIYKGAYLPQVTGDSGTWGGYQNTLTFPIFDANLGGFATQSLTNVNVTLSAAQDQCAILRLTGTLTGNVVITSACQGFKIVENLTTGSYTVTFTTGTGSTLAVPQGIASLVIFDATNGTRIGSSQLSSANGVFSGYITSGSYITAVSYATIGTTLSVGQQVTLTEIATPSSPSAGSIQIYGYSGDFLASQTSGGVQRIYGKDPTVQRFLSGTGTATPSTGAVRWEVEMCAAGAGGNGAGTAGTTSLGVWTTIGGSGQAGGTGGTNGTGTLIDRLAGGDGQGNQYDGGAQGGSNPRGGGGSGANLTNPYSPGNGKPNTGGGGGGYGASSATGGIGGGAGEWVRFYISNPTALSYAIGSGSTNGSTGGSGYIGIIEYYN